MIVLYIIGIFLTVLLNLLTIIVLSKKCKKLTHFDLIMISLSINDIMQALVGYSLELYSTVNYSHFHTSLCCKVAGFTITFLGLVSISHLVGISIQRTIIMSNPFKARKWRTQPFMSIYIIIPSWLYALLWAGMPLFGWSSYDRQQGDATRCSIKFNGVEKNETTYAFCLLVFCFLIPVVVLTLSSVLTVIEMRKMTDTAICLGLTKRNVGSRRTYEIRQTIMLFVIITVFLVSWSPYAACAFIQTLQGTIGSTMLNFSSMFAKASTLYNPIIYFTFQKDFRYRCMMLFRCVERKSIPSIASLYTLDPRNNLDDMTETML